jgi:hypothetical protein
MVTLDGNWVDDDWNFLRNLRTVHTLRVLGVDIPNLSRLSAFAQLRVLHLQDVTSLSPDIAAKIQVNNPYCRVLIGGGRTAMAVGPDPVNLAAAQLLALGVELRGHPFGAYAESPLTVGLVTGPRPYNILCATIPAGVRLTADERQLLGCFTTRIQEFSAPVLSDADRYAPLLSEMRALSLLDLSGSDLTDEGLRVLCKNTGLDQLRVTKTAVTRAGVEAFSRALPQCRITSEFGEFPPPTASSDSLPGATVAAEGRGFAIDLSAKIDSGAAYIELPQNLRPSQPCTVEMWVLPRSVGGDTESRGIWLLGERLALKLVANHLAFIVQRTEGAGWRAVPHSSSIVPGQPVFLAAVSNGHEFNLFIDGRSVGRLFGRRPDR